MTEPRQLREDGRDLTVREYVDGLDWTRDNGKLTKKVWKQWWEGQHVTFCTGPSWKRIPLKVLLFRENNYKKEFIIFYYL